MSVRIPLNDGSGLLSSNPKNDSMELLIKKTLAVGHPLTFDEVRQDAKMIQPNFYAFYYGSFHEAAQIAWKKARTMLTGEIQLKKEEKEYMAPRYTLEEIKKRLASYYKKYGTMPSQTAVTYNAELPSWSTLIKFLGPRSGWEEQILPSTDKDCSPEEEPRPKEVIIPESLVSEGPLAVIEELPSSSSEGVVLLEEEATQHSGSATESVSEGTEPELISQPEPSNDSLPGTEPKPVSQAVPLGEATPEPEEKSTSTEQAIVVADNKNDEVQVEATEHRNEGAITIEIKLALPGRGNPISITLTV